MILVYRQVHFFPAHRQLICSVVERQFCTYYQFICEFLINNIVILWIIFCNTYSILMNEISKIFYMCTFYIIIKFVCIYIVKVKVAQSSLTLCDPMDYTIHGILQARILQWVVFPFSRGSSQPRDWTQMSCIIGGFFISWATREAHIYIYISIYRHTYICILCHI